MTRKSTLTVVASLVALFVLSGCMMRMHQTIELHSDDTLSGSIILAYDLASAEAMGTSRDELVLAVDTDWLLSEQDGSVQAVEYDQDGYVGHELTFDHTDLSHLGLDSGIVIRREGGEFIFSVDLAMYTDTPLPEGVNLGNADVAISVTFPGPVISQQGGVVSGNSVHWDVDLSSEMVVNARGAAVEGGTASFPIVIVLLSGGLLVVLGAVLVMMRKRNSSTAGGPNEVGSTVDARGPAGLDEGLAGLAEAPAGDGYE